MACLIASVSAAFACSALASVTFAVSEAMPGATVSGTGKGFSSAYGGAPSAEPVVAHLDTRTGVVLWSGKPDLGGSFSFSFPAPNAEPGDHTVIFTQTNADGVPVSGTPARALLKILAPPVTTTTTQPTTTSTPAPTVTTPPQTAPPTPAPAAPAPIAPAPDSPAPDPTAPAATTAPKAVPARSPVTAAAATTTTTPAVAPTATPVPAVGPAPDPAPGTGEVALDAQAAGFTSPNSDGRSAAPLVLAVIIVTSVMASAVGIRRFRSRTR